MSKKVSTKNLVALPKLGRAKTVFTILMVVALVLVIRDPLGSAAAFRHFGTAVSTFLNSTGGGFR